MKHIPRLQRWRLPRTRAQIGWRLRPTPHWYVVAHTSSQTVRGPFIAPGQAARAAWHAAEPEHERPMVAERQRARKDAPDG